ncbi:MAG: O-antigen ligase family protein [Bacteroidota bacterium]
MLDLPTEPVRTPRRLALLAAVLGAVVLGFAVAKGGLLVALALLVAAPAFFVMRAVFQDPRRGLVGTVVVAFLGVGITRYVPAPTGLLVDAFLALTLLAVLMQPQRWEWDRLKNGAVAAVVIWMGYNVFQFVNPEARSVTAWFFAVRGVALYPVLAVPLFLLLIRKTRDLDRLLWLWLAFSVLGVLWGAKQKLIGLDGAEQAWLNVPGNLSTHLLFGKLRVFSFYSDSGQFGAAMGHAGLVAIILALGPGSRGRKSLLWIVGALGIYGLLISGTRGAMAVPLVGFAVYFLISGNWRLLTLGMLALAMVYGVLRFTSIGSGIYEVQRMRTAIVQGSDNPSLQVRLENQKRLKAYLTSRPFGGGVGSAGYWGQRFSPGTFLADLALDSWYVKIWAEQGIVGLWLYLAGLAALLTGALRRLLRVRDATLRQRLAALFAGLCGIAVASYGNQVLGQMPTGILVALSLAALYLAPRLDTEPDPPDPVRLGTEAE